MEEERICPYPGLRPFNDDESIFFRGRERNIETIIELFEKKKFMMLTGASGDGKSSLVYAGVVPQAKAGLFKAKYNSWAVADFRPERTPLDNLARSLNNFFKYESVDELKKELGFGFSSLVNLYKKSQLYIHPEGDAWLQADEAKKKQLKRKAANLLIIADQFEEFFTNSENYNNGMASVESQAVINILLETAKTALAEDLPIYIICTMRSDYIGQCAAFRGLPEYIGFSQFFVPRLKRSEIQQVIEEPAQLNGDSISSRLSQRLLFDITEGYDQLPILQHALNQIWKIAGNGKEEMDLLHYAMVGGLPSSELPKEDKGKFDAWFQQLPVFKKQLFLKPSLENILNAHADELLEIAYEKCREKDAASAGKITQDDAKQIIKNTFQCLTKIDDSRAVRNRMTLLEITDIIHNPKIEVKIVSKVLDIFREQGNTFIKPFITENAETKKTNKHTILDLTHESLIRNWDILKVWAKEEHDNFLNFQDFNKQLERWINSAKDSGYLLPIGPLTFFENWYTSCNPNKYWLARYDERDILIEEKLNQAEIKLQQANEFIAKSARKLFITRSVMKYGANKLIAYFGLFILICSCTYYYFDYRKKQNENVLVDIEQRGLRLLRSKKINNKVKADFLINYERLHPGTFTNILNSLKCDTLSYDIALSMFFSCQNLDNFDKVRVNPIVFSLTDYLNGTLTKIYTDKTILKNDVFFKRIGEFVRLCAFIKSYEKKHSSVDDLIQENVTRIYNDYILTKLNQPITDLTFDAKIFNNALELVLNYSEKKRERAKVILSKISPFESADGAKRFDKLYNKENKITYYNQSYSHNGGFQELGYLYSFDGNVDKIVMCLDSIIKYNADYKSNTFYSFNLLAYYLIYSSDNAEKLNVVFKKFEKYSELSHLKCIESVIGSINRYIAAYQLKNLSSDPYENYIKNVVIDSIDKIFDYYHTELKNEIKNEDELTFKLALFYKLRGCLSLANTNIREQYFDKAIEYYSATPVRILNSYSTVGSSVSVDSKNIKKSLLFLYPNVINEGEYWSMYSFWDIRYKLLFANYLLNNPNLQSFFFSKDEWSGFENFLYYYYSSKRVDGISDSDSIEYSYFDLSEKFIRTNPTAKLSIDSNFIYLVKIVKHFEENDTAKAFEYYKKLDLTKILSIGFQTAEHPKGEVNKFLLKSVAKFLAIYSKSSFESTIILANFYQPYDRRNSLIEIIEALQEKGQIENSFVFLDTLYQDIEKNSKYGLKLLEINGMIGGQSMFDLATKLIKDVNDKQKPRALVLFIRGVATNGNYYKALNYIPDYVSSSNELELYTEIMKAEVKKQSNLSQELKLQSRDFNDYYKSSSTKWSGDFEMNSEGGIIVIDETN